MTFHSQSDRLCDRINDERKFPLTGRQPVQKKVKWNILVSEASILYE